MTAQLGGDAIRRGVRYVHGGTGGAAKAPMLDENALADTLGSLTGESSAWLRQADIRIDIVESDCLREEMAGQELAVAGPQPAGGPALHAGGRLRLRPDRRLGADGAACGTRLGELRSDDGRPIMIIANTNMAMLGYNQGPVKARRSL